MEGISMRFDHPADSLLIALLDDELPVEQAAATESHLAGCEACRAKVRMWRGLSSDIEQVMRSMPVESASENVASLDAKLQASEIRRVAPRRSLNRFAWAAALAASLATIVLIAPRMRERSVQVSRPVATAPLANTVEVEGETFISLPYSNPDLPANNPHIVQMEVSVASLADAGIMFEPIANQVADGRDSVLADVLFGVDGQPLGVHVLNAE